MWNVQYYITYTASMFTSTIFIIPPFLEQSISFSTIFITGYYSTLYFIHYCCFVCFSWVPTNFRCRNIMTNRKSLNPIQAHTIFHRAVNLSTSSLLNKCLSSGMYFFHRSHVTDLLHVNLISHKMFHWLSFYNGWMLFILIWPKWIRNNAVNWTSHHTGWNVSHNTKHCNSHKTVDVVEETTKHCSTSKDTELLKLGL